MEPFMEGACCVMCNRGVHWEAGRVACDGCDLPTDCCLCDPVLSGTPRRPSQAP